VTHDNAGIPGAATAPDWLFDHEKQLADAKALVERRASEMRATQPGTAEREQAQERVEEAMRRLRTRSTQLQEHRAATEKARLRAERSVQWRRPTLILTAAQAVAVVLLLIAGVITGMSVFAWIVVVGGALLCAAQYAVARDGDRGGWPPAAATLGCVLLVLAGLTALDVLPAWVGVPAALIAAGIATVIAADRFFAVDLLEKLGVKAP
jgi:hypothetical protein